MMNFVDFLNTFRVEKNSMYSHTGMGNTRGKFFVPSEQMDVFYNEYAQSIKAGENVCIMEKHKSISPILVDIDFRYDHATIDKRQHTQEDLQSIADIYADHIVKLVDVPGNFNVYIFEKPEACVANNVLKDGIHIIIPEIVSRPSVQLLLREAVVADKRMQKIYKRLLSTNSLDNAIDELVIYKNAWMAYGSRKPDNHPYDISVALRYKPDGTLKKVLSEDLSVIDRVKLFSIRNKTKCNKINPECQDEISKIEARFEKKSVVTHSNTSNNTVAVSKNDEDIVMKLVDILNPQRAESYDEWVRMGWCLRNIGEQFLDAWISFSRKSSKFMDGECERKWYIMKREGGLGIGTLHMWAKTDNPEEYSNIVRSNLYSLIIKSLSMSHYDVSCVVYNMFRYQFVCAGIRNRIWYEFKNHRWYECDSGYSLRIKISTDVWREYAAASSNLQSKAIASSDEQEQEKFQEQSKKLLDLSMKLKNTTYKENIMKECAEMFYTEKFEEKLDSAPHLLCFDNGIYDMNNNEFREGRPEDYMSFSTGCSYIPYDGSHPVIKQINRFFEQVQPKDCKRMYLLSLFACFLSGQIKDQKFHIWTGSGSNGKSVCVELFEKAIGQYCCKFPITLLTQKRAASNAATGELARAKGRRIAVLQEPSEDEKLQVGLMKELTGGDTIMCRALYKDPIEYKPQYKLVLLCNHLPTVPSDDGGTWRRIRVIEFTSKFVDNPKEDNEFPIDLELSSKFDAWKEHFISMLLNVYYPIVQAGPISEPEDVLMCTREYQHNNDHMSHFIQMCIEKADASFLSVDDAFTELKNWVRDDNVPFKVTKKNEFLKVLERKLGKSIKTGGCVRFKGFKIRNRYQKAAVNEDDDIDF
jgi:P4 family phage/plasmid primase-like protien